MYQGKNSWQKERASWMEPKRSGNPGRYFMVRNWLSEYGLSSETWGRLWVLVTPRSASSKATGFEVMDEPRSAWMVSWPGSISCFPQVSLNESFGQFRALPVGDHPADDIAAEDIEDDVQIEVGPLRRPAQFGDVPAPELVGAGGQQFRLLIRRMHELIAALAVLALLFQHPVHGADRAMIPAFVEQCGIDRAGEQS